MTTTPETLTRLVADRVGDGRDSMSYRAFEQRAVDPDSGYRPSRNTIWKIRHGKPVNVDPRLVGAIAAGLGLDPQRVQAAAAYQYTGYVASRVVGGVAVLEPGAEPGRLAEEAVDRWDREEKERGNHAEG